MMVLSHFLILIRLESQQTLMANLVFFTSQLCYEIKKKARALITFAGMVACVIESRISSQLVQLEVMMN